MAETLAALVADANKEEVSTDYILDVTKVREQLVKNNIAIGEVESFFSDPASEQSRRLVGLVTAVQRFIREGNKGLIVVTNNLSEVSKFLMGLCYTWSSTINKSSGIHDTKTVCRITKDSFVSFTNEIAEDTFLQLRSTSLLVLTGFLPVDAKSFRDMAKEIEPLIVQRFTEVKNTFTVFVAFHPGEPKELDANTAEIVGKLKTHLTKDYGYTAGDTIEANSEIITMFFNRKKLECSVL